MKTKGMKAKSAQILLKSVEVGLTIDITAFSLDFGGRPALCQCAGAPQMVPRSSMFSG